MSPSRSAAIGPDLQTAPEQHGARAPAQKQRAAGLSVASNSTLILLKVIAGTITGSVAILTEAVHSSVDVVASLVAFFSVRKAGEPADETHRYGHERMEDLAAAIEGVLILVGSAAIAFAAIRRLLQGGRTHTVGLGIAVIAFSTVVNLVVSAVLARRGRSTGSPALSGDAAHLRTDALSSGVVLLALVLVDATGRQWIDPAAALLVAGTIVITGVRLLKGAGQVLVDQALPTEQVAAIRQAIESFGSSHGVVGYHELRSRSGGSQRYVDVHVQFRSGTSLEDAHRTAHELQDVIADALGGADVLIHLEPEDRVRPGQTLPARPSSPSVG
ncbi:MAG TPA: cation diffusion facilitator family transporter [Solirubrobacteraceae bacterium]|nr:cation diffusion facilitator family transporter [Solirubrobacteraceae bacterium]